MSTRCISAQAPIAAVKDTREDGNFLFAVVWNTMENVVNRNIFDLVVFPL